MSWMEVRQVIRSLVVSSTSNRYSIRDLERDFFQSEGYRISPSLFGYNNFFQMLQNMDDINVVGFDSNAYVTPKNVAKSAHIVKYTKFGGKKRSGQSGNNRSNQRRFENEPHNLESRNNNFQVVEKDFREKLRMADIDDETPSTSNSLSSSEVFEKVIRMRPKPKTSTSSSSTSGKETSLKAEAKVIPACQPIVKPPGNSGLRWCEDIEQVMVKGAMKEVEPQMEEYKIKKYVTNINYKIPSARKLDLTSSNEKIFQIKILDGRSLHRLWFNRTEEADSITRVMKTMTKFYSSDESNELFLNKNTAVPGLYCAAEYNDVWHRVKILQTLPDDKCKLLYIDFGTVDVKPIKELKFLALKFTKYPILALRGLITNVKILNGEESWHFEAMKSLNDLLFVDITARVHKYDSTGSVYYLTLTVSVDGSETDFGEYIIKNGWASRNMHLQSPVISPGEISFEIYENGIDLELSDSETEGSYSSGNKEVPDIEPDFSFNTKEDDVNGNQEIGLTNRKENAEADIVNDPWIVNQVVKNFNLLRSIHNDGRLNLTLNKLPDDMRRFNTGRFFPYKDRLFECDYMWYVFQKFHFIKIQSMTSPMTFKFYFLEDFSFMVKCLRTLNEFYRLNQNYKLPKNDAEVNRIVVVENDGSFVRARIEKKLSGHEFQLYLLDFGKSVTKKDADFFMIYPEFLKWPPFVHNGRFAEIEQIEGRWNAEIIKSFFNSLDENLMQVQVHNFFLLNQEYSLYVFDRENMFLNKQLCERRLATYKIGI